MQKSGISSLQMKNVGRIQYLFEPTNKMRKKTQKSSKHMFPSFKILFPPLDHWFLTGGPWIPKRFTEVTNLKFYNMFLSS